MTSSIQQINDVLEDVDINKTIEDWSLNDDQACAFRVISQHSLQNRPKQLRMYLGGLARSGNQESSVLLKIFLFNEDSPNGSNYHHIWV